MTVEINNQVWPLTTSTDLKLVPMHAYHQPCCYVLSKKRLGNGSFSTVFECKHKVSGKHYAAKQYQKKLVYGLESLLQNEFEILKRVSNTHPNILSLIDYFETADDLYFVTDLATGGELFDRIINHPNSRLPEEQVIEITKNLVSVISTLHSNRIVHRDIKAENLLFKSRNSNNTSILLADFGFARHLQDGKLLYDQCGTLSYLAPECLNSKVGHSFPVDMWALGVLVYFMLCGYMPFDCDNDEETKETIAKADYMFDPPEYWDHISQNAKDFISACFEINPDYRLTAMEASCHPFINLIPEFSLPRATSSSVSLAKALKESVSKLQLRIYEAPPLSKTTSNSSSTSYHTFNSPMLKSRLHSFTSLRTSATSIPKILSAGSLIDNSRTIDRFTLQGERCTPPDLVSNFTTPLASMVNSRQHSYNDMITSEPKKLPLQTKKLEAKFFL